MITDKDVREYFEHNPKSKGVAIFMIDLDFCDTIPYDEPDCVIMNEGRQLDNIIDNLIASIYSLVAIMVMTIMIKILNKIGNDNGQEKDR